MPTVVVNIAGGGNINYGQQVPTISATVSGSGPVPTGTVNFSMNPAQVTDDKDYTLDSGGNVTWPLLNLSGGPLLPPNVYNVYADYNGDSNYLDGYYGDNSLHVHTAPSETTWSSCPSSVTAGQLATFKTNVQWANTPTVGGAVEPTGSVAITAVASTGSVTTATGLLSQGIPGAPSTVTIKMTLQTGTYAVTAAYQGDSNYIPDTSAVQVAY